MKFFKPFEMPTIPQFPDYTVDIRDFGAVSGDGSNSAKSINEAIKKCSASGGGKVIVPKGVWHTGAIHLQSNVNLHFEEGSEVHFSTEFSDYLPVVYGILGGNRCYSVSHFLYAYQCKNIAITGSGTLNGHGEAWWHMRFQQPGMEDLLIKGREGKPLSERVYDKPEDGVRPRMLQFVECENVLIEGIHMCNSPSWTVHPAWCKNITVRNLTINNPYEAPNVDGVNFESCKRGLIEGCHITTGDDVICLKAGRDEDAWEVGIPCEDIEVRNCVARTGHGGITIGSETSASIRNAYFHDCDFGELYSAIRIKTMKGRGGVIENIDYENINIEKANIEAFMITLRYAGESLDDQTKPEESMPIIRNISVKGLKCTASETGVSILGTVGRQIENVYISDSKFFSERPIEAEYVENLNLSNVDLKVTI